MIRALIAGCLAVLPYFPVVANAADTCRVHDAELQGEFSGPCLDGFAHGQGTAKGIARYTGAFVAGRKHGTGVKEWPNGDRYEGEFREDRKHGYGTYRWGRGSEWPGQQYSGSYAEDLRHGAGAYVWPDGRQLAGHWIKDQPPPVMSAAMQATVRAHADRMVSLMKPGTKVCREFVLGTVQRDMVSGVVLGSAGDRVRIQLQRVGQFSGQLDGRPVANGDEVVVYPDHWFACR